MERVGPYQIIGELGRGGAGVVLRAFDPRLRREVAVKVLHATRATGAQIARFAREARALAKVRHPNVVAVHEVANDAARPYIVMDLVDGESLGARLGREGPLPVREAATIVAALARALDVAHAQGVVHRDVKPDNVIIARSGAPLLTDFGLAKDLDDGSHSISIEGRFIGTPGYASPEQARGRGDPGPACDVYGLGATLWGLLVGEPPFTGRTAVEVIVATLSRAAEPPSSVRPDVPPDLDAICLRCLEKEPADRFASAAELADALERHIRGEPLRDHPGSRPRPAQVAAAGRAAAALAVVALLAGSAAAVIGWWHLRARQEWERDRADLDRRVTAAETRLDGRRRAWEAERAALEARLDESESAAAAAVEKAAASRPKEPDARTAAARAEAAPWVESARLKFVAGRLGDAAADLDRAIRIDPLDASTRSKRGVTRRELGDLGGALEDLDAAIALDPSLAPAWIHRGITRDLLDDSDGAIADFDRALALAKDPRDPQIIYNRALARWRGGDRAGALADIDVSIAGRPTARAYATRASIKMRDGDHEAALADFGLSIALEPDFAPALHDRAQLHVTLGRIDDALADLDATVAADPRRVPAFFDRAVLRERKGDVEGAIADLEMVTRLDPRGADAIEARAQLRRIRAARGGD